GLEQGGLQAGCDWHHDRDVPVVVVVVREHGIDLLTGEKRRLAVRKLLCAIEEGRADAAHAVGLIVAHTILPAEDRLDSPLAASACSTFSKQVFRTISTCADTTRRSESRTHANIAKAPIEKMETKAQAPVMSLTRQIVPPGSATVVEPPCGMARSRLP